MSILHLIDTHYLHTSPEIKLIRVLSCKERHVMHVSLYNSRLIRFDHYVVIFWTLNFLPNWNLELRPLPLKISALQPSLFSCQLRLAQCLLRLCLYRHSWYNSSFSISATFGYSHGMRQNMEFCLIIWMDRTLSVLVSERQAGMLVIVFVRKIPRAYLWLKGLTGLDFFHFCILSVKSGCYKEIKYVFFIFRGSLWWS